MISVADTGQNLDFALKTLSSSLEIISRVSMKPLSYVSYPPPGPQGLNISEVVRMKLTVDETQKILDCAFSRLLLSHYRNQLIHLFLAEAMLAFCIYHSLPCTQCRSLLSSHYSIHHHCNKP